jgi:hypothetical protein
VELVEHRDLAVVLARGRREDDLHVELRQRLRGAGEHSGEVGRIDERDEDPDEPRPPGREAAGAAVGRVAVLADHPGDGLAGLGSNIVPAVEDSRDSGDRDAG